MVTVTAAKRGSPGARVREPKRLGFCALVVLGLWAAVSLTNSGHDLMVRERSHLENFLKDHRQDPWAQRISTAQREITGRYWDSEEHVREAEDQSEVLPPVPITTEREAAEEAARAEKEAARDKREAVEKQATRAKQAADEKEAAEKAAIEKAAIEKAAVEKAAIEKAAIEEEAARVQTTSAPIQTTSAPIQQQQPRLRATASEQEEQVAKKEPRRVYASNEEARSAPKGELTCDGDRVESELIYWREVPKDMAMRHEGADSYLSFEYDSGGWNNIRMGVECVFVFAHATGRTIVLPPAQPLYLISKSHGERRAFGLADFLNVTLLGSHAGWKTIEMPEFLEKLKKEAATPFPDDVSGRRVWKYLEKSSNALLPSISRKFFLLEDDDGGDNTTTQYTDRLKSFVGPEKRTILKNTIGLKRARHVHSPGSDKHRILMSHYAYAMFKHDRRQSFYRRFIRDYARYRNEIHCAAHDVVLAIREKAAGGNYSAIHARRNDFQYRDAKISASEIVENLKGNELIPRGSLVYLATDDPKGTCAGCMYQRKQCHEYEVPRPKGSGCPDDTSWTAFEENGWTVVKLGDFLDRPALKNVNPNYYGMIDQLVCGRADVFAGTFWLEAAPVITTRRFFVWYRPASCYRSTFTGYIHRVRGYHGLGKKKTASSIIKGGKFSAYFRGGVVLSHAWASE